MTLGRVSFPVFRLTSRPPLVQEGVAYYSNSYIDIDTNEISTHIKLLDDKNVRATTLASRRLWMKEQGAPLYPLRRAVFFMGDFIKVARSDYWFIDSNGFIFKYKKTIKVPLRFRRIKRVIAGRTTGSILEVEGIPERFKTMFIVRSSMKYAAILEYKGINILYGVYDQRYKDTWRRI